MRIWIDFTNSPHVLVLRPVLQDLEQRGHEVVVTARDFAQTLELCERFDIPCTQIGYHRGAKRLAKAQGLFERSTQLTKWARKQDFSLAVGHGSNDITIAAAVLKIPSTTMFDYEWATVQHRLNLKLVQRALVPDSIPFTRLTTLGSLAKIARYPGLKEEYYLADFEPDQTVLEQLQLAQDRLIAVVRTPPEVALYHRVENDLFMQTLFYLQEQNVQTVVLPRTTEQREALTNHQKLIIPKTVIDAQSLLAFADIVVSAGGTMNREAVALGTPVWTTFAGKMGAVDEQLIREGLLQVLTKPEDLKLEKQTDTERKRVRRDPKVWTDLLLDCAK